MLPDVMSPKLTPDLGRNLYLQPSLALIRSPALSIRKPSRPCGGVILENTTWRRVVRIAQRSGFRIAMTTRRP